MTQTPQTIIETMFRLSGEIGSLVSQLEERSRMYARADAEYHEARAKALLKAKQREGCTVAEAESEAQIECSRLYTEYRLADALRDSAREALRSRRDQLSALQSALAALRSEMDLTRTEPREIA